MKIKKMLGKKISIVLCLLLLSCNHGFKTRKYELLDIKIEKFDNLNKEVQKVFRQSDMYLNGEDMPNMINLDSLKKYSFITNKSGPFIDSYFLIDSVNKLKYKLPYGICFPIVVFQSRLYLPSENNLTNKNSDFTNIHFEITDLEAR